MCRWVSIIPGITMPPRASISYVPGGTSSAGPTAAIRSPVTRTSASVRTVWASSIVRTVPPRRTTGWSPDGTTTSLSGWDTGGLQNSPGSTDACPYDGRARRRGHLGVIWADLGAEVVKVEGPAGDDTRSWQPPVREGVATYYLGVNRNKRSVALDLRDPDDLAAARELARRADVLVENFKPGGLARFGLDHATVSATNPGVVYASISGFGSGPGGAALPGYDLIVQAISGLMSLTGDPDGEPYRAGVAVFDVMAGLHATIGVLSALNLRHENGRGQHVEVNLLSSALSGLVNQTSAFVAGGIVPFRMGNSHPSLFPYEPLPCADGELIVTAGNDGQFRRLCEVLGAPELGDDPRFLRNEDRTAHRDELRPLLVDRLRTRG